jgi:DNA-binding transcriptional LysR family regulator
MHFSLRQIAVFDAVARLGSVSRAAEEIALSQSAASMALKELEDNLGTKLFHRHGRKLILNESGRRLRPKAHSIMLLAAEIARPPTEELEGVLRIAASATVGNYLLPECSAAFLRRHPKVRIDVISGPILELVERVEAMSVDLGLLDTPCNRSTLVVEPVGQDRAVVFAHPAHPLARQRHVSLDDLRAASWCLRELPSLTRSHLTSTLGGPGLDIRFVASTYEAVKAAVKCELGIGFASTQVIAREVAAGDLAVIKADALALDRTFTLLSPKRVYQGALPSAFADHLREWFAAHRTRSSGKAEAPRSSRPSRSRQA